MVTRDTSRMELPPEKGANQETKEKDQFLGKESSQLGHMEILAQARLKAVRVNTICICAVLSLLDDIAKFISSTK